VDLFSIVSISWRTRIQNTRGLPEVGLNYGKLWGSLSHQTWRWVTK